MSGLLRTGGIKMKDKPIWVDVWEAFPPKLEPSLNRTAEVKQIPNIFYPEDKIRA